MPAVVVWANQGGPTSDSDNFASNYGTALAPLARAIVNRAIDDWNAVIKDQNYDNDNNPNTNHLTVTILATDLGTGTRGLNTVTEMTTGGTGQAGWTTGVPVAATIRLDNDGGGAGWFFDTTPSDDVEFGSIASSFASSFVDATTVGQQHIHDFYAVVAHEIGHALGIGLQYPVGASGVLRIWNHVNYFDADGDGNVEYDTNPISIGGGSPLIGYFHSDGSITMNVVSEVRSKGQNPR